MERYAKHAAHAAHAVDPSVLDACAVVGSKRRAQAQEHEPSWCGLERLKICREREPARADRTNVGRVEQVVDVEVNREILGRSDPWEPVANAGIGRRVAQAELKRFSRPCLAASISNYHSAMCRVSH